MSDSSHPVGRQHSPAPAPASTHWRRTDRKILALGWFVIVGVGVACLLTFPSTGGHDAGMRRAQSQYNLSNIQLALINYEVAHRELPPAVVTNAAGEPLYSWRVLVLRELECPELYERFDLTQAWDSPTNRPLINEMPDVFRSPFGDIDAAAGLTPYQALVDTTGTRTAMGRTEGKRFTKVKDGLSNTAFLVENRRHPVIWTKPYDTDPAELLAELSAEGADADVTVGFCDFAIKRLQDDFLTVFPGAMYSNDGKVPPR